MLLQLVIPTKLPTPAFENISEITEESQLPSFVIDTVKVVNSKSSNGTFLQKFFSDKSRMNEISGNDLVIISSKRASFGIFKKTDEQDSFQVINPELGI
jgi:hypothetical protein